METLLSAFRYIFNHVETTVGVSIALILVTGILLLVRMIMEKPASTSAGASANLDVEALEGTLKRVLGQAQGITSASSLSSDDLSSEGGAGAVAGGNPGDAARLQALVAEREKMIAELQGALAQAKAAKADAPAGGDAIAMLELQNKVRDLEARLAEYSIIEDDIADLSMYKDENLRLKQELDGMRSGAPVASAASGDVAQPAGGGIDIGDLAQAKPADPVDEFANIVSGHAAPALEAEKSVQAPEPKVEDIVSQDAIDAMFATAVAAETDDSADGPLMGSVDTSKMLDEVASLEAQPESSEDILEAALDTDKLLSEVDALKSAATSDPTPDEDLFGEFKDEEKSQG